MAADANSKGVLFALMTALVSGTSVFVNSYAVKGFEPFSFVAVRNLAVVLLLVAGVLLAGQLSAVRSLSRRQWAALAFIGLIGGAIPFLLYFQGLALVASAARASFLYRSLFFIAAILGIVWMKERVTRNVIIGVGIAMLGNLLLLGNAAWNAWGVGELLVLGATVMWACEYAVAKKVMKEEEISPRLLALGRMGFGALILLAFTAFTGQLWAAEAYSPMQWEWVAISAAFLFAFVGFWYAGLASTTLTNATAALVLGGPLTALLSLAFAGAALEPLSALGLLLMSVGSCMVIGYSNIAQLPATLKRLFVWKTRA
ncbi:MAG: DMT family transporter [Candidatus Burarchaeum sp.]|nr:DMT family transporter [Candidatus Burarchaeum sp.]MDO8339573.1 DMT family transporter [Candidatus Burarchaeum sp.]